MSKLNLVNNRVEDYTIILSNKSFQHYGQLTGIKSNDLQGSFNLISANEMSFQVYKYKLIPNENVPYKNIETFQKYIWSNLVDRKLIYVKELDEYYQIKVSIDDSKDTVKTVQARTLCEEELSQLNLNNNEINTEGDRATNGETVFYNPENPNNSLLHRILKDKAPHYTIKHVDASLCNLARTFTLSGTSIYDFMVGECSEQFDCLFRFNSKERGIYVYDLLTVCQDCGERGDFTDECPKCGSKNLKRYGKDTPIYVDKSNLTDAIHLEIDSDSVKNCFKLECGDEVMTAAVRSINPNGTDYLFYISDDDKADMPKELVQKLDEYDKAYQEVLPTYQDLTLQIRNLNDDILYYKHSMMPTVEYVDELADVLDPKEGIVYICNDIVYFYNGEELTPSSEDAKFYTDLFPTSDMITAQSEADKLTKENLNPLAISELTDSTTLTTVNSTLKNYAKVYVKSGYVKLEIEDGATFSISEETGLGTWNGRFKVTSYSDEEDIAYSEYLTLEVNDNHNEQITQKVLKAIANDDEENSIFDVLAIYDLDVFKETLALYSLSRLESFKSAISGAQMVLATSGQGEVGTELYEPLYTPYTEKIKLCDNEIDARQAKIDSLTEELNALQQEQSDIQSSLNLQDYLGNLYPIFCSYRREDTYSNSNFISDGLDNAQIIERAKQFWELAQKEIQKAANGKCTITASLYNLLAIPEFKPLVDYFELGNRIRVKVDDVLYVLMLIGYSLNFGDLNTIEVTFATATKVSNEQTKEDDILESAKQMAKSYDSVQKQAEQGKEANTEMKSIVQNGLDSSLVTIKNNNNEEVTYGKHGILLREKDDITGGYSPKQSRLIHNSIVMTKDNWETASLGLGEHSYTYYNEETKKFEKTTDYGISARFGHYMNLYGSQYIGGDIYSEDYDANNGVGSHIGLKGVGNFQFGRKLSFDGTNLELSGRITAESGYIGSDEYDYQWVIGNDEERAYIYNGTDSMTSTVIGTYLGTDGFRNYQSDEEYVTIQNGVINAYGGSIVGATIISSDGTSSGTISLTRGILTVGSAATYMTLANAGMNFINNGTIVGRFRSSSQSLWLESTVNNMFVLGHQYNKVLTINENNDGALMFWKHLYGYTAEFSDTEIIGNFSVTGTKSRIATTENYNDRLLYCYETPSPMFGDIGEGQIDETGKCYIFIDDIFAETIDTDCTYQVFLQSYGQGECYVTERTSSYFIVEGTENLSFGWEIKAIQKDFDTIRLEELQTIESSQDYAEETYNYLIESLEE